MKILITSSIFPPEIGGPATYAKEFSERAAKLGHDVKVVTLYDKPPNAAKDVAIVPVKRKGGKLKRHGSLFSQILKSARGMDVIYAQNPAAIGLPSAMAAKVLRKPLAVKFVGDSAWEKAFREGKTTKFLEDFLAEPDANKSILKIERFVFSRAKRIITPSNFLKNILVKYHDVPEEKVSVIHNAVNVEGLKKLSRKKAKQPTIITVARLVPWKGIQHVLSVMPELLKKYPKLKYRIVGEGPFKKDLKKLVSALKLKKNVEFLGALPNKKTVEHIAMADAFVLNSLYEGMPHVLMESMAVGTPVLASEICGNPELIGDEGLLFPPNDEEAISKAISSVIGNKAYAVELRKKSFARIKDYSWEPLVENTLKTLSFYR